MKLHSVVILTLSIVCGTMFFQSNAFVEAEEQNLTKNQALDILFGHFGRHVNPDYVITPPTFKQYWLDVWPSDTSYALVTTACDMEVITCNNIESYFQGDSTISLPVFLKIFYTMKWENSPELLTAAQQAGEYGPWYAPYLFEALGDGILSEGTPIDTLSGDEALAILNRDLILSSYDGVLESYFPGLEANPYEVTTAKYYNIDRTRKTLEHYNTILAEGNAKVYRLRDTGKSEELSRKLEQLSAVRDAFATTLATLEENPLLYDPELSDTVKEKVRELGVREKVGESEYDFSKSPSYRKTNIKIALAKIDGMVLMPDEEFNFADKIYDNGLREFLLGWVIIKGKEEKAVGGGICGAATAIFEAAYRSGLQITERREHTIFYRSFYPMEKFGLDAAVYGSRPNLRFKNNTGSPLLLHVRYPKDNVVNLQMLGNRHFQEVTLTGPNRKGNTARWVRTILYKDGSSVVDELVSRFSKIH